MRTPRRRRPGLLSEPGRGFGKYLALFAQHPVLAAQPVELFALAGGQAIAAQAFVECGLLDPFANGVGRGLKLARQLVDLPPRARQLDDSPPVFRRVWWMTSRHWGPPCSFFPNTVFETGSSPDLQSRIDPQVHMLRHFGPLIPGQGLPNLFGQAGDGARDGVADRFCTMTGERGAV